VGEFWTEYPPKSQMQKTITASPSPKTTQISTWRKWWLPANLNSSSHSLNPILNNLKRNPSSKSKIPSRQDPLLISFKIDLKLRSLNPATKLLHIRSTFKNLPLIRTPMSPLITQEGTHPKTVIKFRQHLRKLVDLIIEQYQLQSH